MTNSAERKAIVETAADYVVKLYSGDICEQDYINIQSWLAEDERHFQEYQNMLNAWDALGDYPLKKDQIESEKKLREKFLNLYKLMSIAASICLLAVTIFLFYPVSKEQESQLVTQYQTLVGEQKTITLADGSLITLNTNTLLHIDFRDGKRHLKLAFGEAFFDVAKDPDNPMQIDLTSHKVTVLGTKFSLYKSALEVKVAVVEGFVSLDSLDNPGLRKVSSIKNNSTDSQTGITSKNSGSESPNKKILLSAGDAVNVSIKTKNPITIKKTNVAKLNNWREGLIRFDNKPLFEVASELNRYSRRKILIEDENIMKLPVTGICRFDDIETILKAIDATLPVEIIHYSDRYVILGEK